MDFETTVEVTASLHDDEHLRDQESTYYVVNNHRLTQMPSFYAYREVQVHISFAYDY